MDIPPPTEEESTAPKSEDVSEPPPAEPPAAPPEEEQEQEEKETPKEEELPEEDNNQDQDDEDLPPDVQIPDRLKPDKLRVVEILEPPPPPIDTRIKTCRSLTSATDIKKRDSTKDEEADGTQLLEDHDDFYPQPRHKKQYVMINPEDIEYRPAAMTQFPLIIRQISALAHAEVLKYSCQRLLPLKVTPTSTSGGVPKTRTHTMKRVSLFKDPPEPMERKLNRLKIYRRAFGSMVIYFRAYSPLLFHIKRAFEDVLRYRLRQFKEAQTEKIRICHQKISVETKMANYRFPDHLRLRKAEQYLNLLFLRIRKQDEAIQHMTAILTKMEASLSDHYEKYRDMEDQIKLLDVELYELEQRNRMPKKLYETPTVAEPPPPPQPAQPAVVAAAAPVRVEKLEKWDVGGAENAEEDNEEEEGEGEEEAEAETEPAVDKKEGGGTGGRAMSGGALSFLKSLEEDAANETIDETEEFDEDKRVVLILAYGVVAKELEDARKKLKLYERKNQIQRQKRRLKLGLLPGDDGGDDFDDDAWLLEDDDDDDQVKKEEEDDEEDEKEDDDAEKGEKGENEEDQEEEEGNEEDEGKEEDDQDDKNSEGDGDDNRKKYSMGSDTDDKKKLSTDSN